MNQHSKPRQSGSLVVAMLSVVLALAPGAQAQSRGELLYFTHYGECHTTQMQWRDKKAAIDWASLKFQVRRWQDASRHG